MRDRMMPLDRVAAWAINREFTGAPRIGRILIRYKMQPRVAALLRIYYAPELAALLQFSSIAHLPAGFSVCCGCFEDHRGFVLDLHRFENFGGRGELLVTNEFCRRGVL